MKIKHRCILNYIQYFPLQLSTMENDAIISITTDGQEILKIDNSVIAVT